MRLCGCQHLLWSSRAILPVWPSHPSIYENDRGWSPKGQKDQGKTEDVRELFREPPVQEAEDIRDGETEVIVKKKQTQTQKLSFVDNHSRSLHRYAV
ncbi:hypothetical protein GOP47_0001470 [Adiantum capillus-veneris]|uniref:Uncharacterized protein n=1 Tax=Adiantum capillus-veneris TaxID=13818 RepID=A0A9D4ZQ20_ADICA|nr:hypothetical protein GOP47_0001470 [Adiantum capillus-veneris]